MTTLCESSWYFLSSTRLKQLSLYLYLHLKQVIKITLLTITRNYCKLKIYVNIKNLKISKLIVNDASKNISCKVSKIK